MHNLQYTNQFKKDLKRIKKRSASNFEILGSFLKELQINGYTFLQPKNNLHKLSGKFSKYWECHILPDLLIIWFYQSESDTFVLVRTGTHSDLFN